jgi:hypothetical protein
MARPVVRRFFSVGLDFRADDPTGRRTGDMRIAFRLKPGGTSFDQPSSFIPLRLSTVNRLTYDLKKSWHSVFRPTVSFNLSQQCEAVKAKASTHGVCLHCGVEQIGARTAPNNAKSVWRMGTSVSAVPLLKAPYPRSLIAYGPLPFCGDRGRSPRIGGRRGRAYGVDTYPGLSSGRWTRNCFCATNTWLPKIGS